MVFTKINIIIIMMIILIIMIMIIINKTRTHKMLPPPGIQRFAALRGSIPEVFGRFSGFGRSGGPYWKELSCSLKVLDRGP